jgi:endonuclease/exonuclease/phosphatase family metal-dependent hydrolase
MSLTFLAAAAVIGLVFSLASPAVPATVMRFSVASFNVKDPDSTAQGPWTTRGRRSASAVVSQGVKLLGAQELFEDDERQQYLTYINSAAGGAYYDMVPAPSSSAGEDSRILFDKRVFTHVASGGKSYNTQNGSEDRAFAWGKFRHRATGRYVLFVTTRLSPRSDSADVAQWKELIGWLNRRRNETPYYKFVVTGDFNTTKFESPATMLAKMRSNGYEDVLGQQYRSYSTYRNPSVRVDANISTSNRGDRNTAHYSVAQGRNGNGIDYVFVTKALKATYYRVYAQPRTGSIMNYLTSDHFIVKATISQ